MQLLYNNALDKLFVIVSDSIQQMQKSRPKKAIRPM